LAGFHRNCETSYPARSLGSLRTRIICQTVSDFAAGQLIDEARKMNPNVLALAISQVGQERNLNVELFEVQMIDPGRLRRVVTRLLQQADYGKRLA
jgi:hypothetical protein